MSEDTMIKRMDKSAFFDSVTWLNQENWQKFFGKSLPNGILVNHALKLDNTGYRIADMMDLVEGDKNLTIGTGSVMANGLYSEIITPTSVTNVTSAEKTKFIVIRYDSDESFASIVQKVDVLTEDNISITNAIHNFVVDESFLCTRNESIYEIPIAFQYYSDGVHTVDLRHFVYAPSGMKRVLSLDTVYNSSEVKLGVLRGNNYAQLIGGTSYNITIGPQDSDEYFNIYPLVVNSNEPITLYIRNGIGLIRNLNFKQTFGNYTIDYMWVDAWTKNSQGVNTPMSPNSSLVVRLDVVKQDSKNTIYSVTTRNIGEGGDIDIDTIYNKSEINNMLASKANTTDVNAWLSTKENISNLKSLAYKDKVNYETEVTNKPTFGALASKDKVDYSTDIINKPTSFDYETDVTNKPTLGTLASKNSVNYETEVTNKPTLGTLAFKNTVDFETEVTNKKVNYETEVTNKPTLGTLASKEDCGLSDNYYARRKGEWAVLGSMANVNDVGNNNTDYIRRNNSWTTLQSALVKKFYVDASNGDDNNNGTESAPFKTWKKAIDSIQMGGHGTIIIQESNALPVQEPIVIINKSINFESKNNGVVRISSLSSSSIEPFISIRFNSTIVFRNATKWDFRFDSDNSSTLFNVEGSRLIFSNEIDINKQITLSSASQLSANKINLINMSGYQKAITSNSASIAFISSVTGGYSDSTGAVFNANGGIIMFGSVDYKDSRLITANGGHIFSKNNKNDEMSSQFTDWNFDEN